jgi:hypothetical protein
LLNWWKKATRKFIEFSFAQYGDLAGWEYDIVCAYCIRRRKFVFIAFLHVEQQQGWGGELHDVFDAAGSAWVINHIITTMSSLVSYK